MTTSEPDQQGEPRSVDLVKLNDTEFNAETYDRLMTLSGTVAVIVINDEEYEVTVNDEGFEIALVFEAEDHTSVSIGFDSDGQLNIANESGRDISTFTQAVVEESILELERNRDEKAKIAREMLTE